MDVYREEVFFKVCWCILYVSHWNFTGIVIQGKKLSKVDSSFCLFFFVLECGTLYLCVLCHSVSDEAQRGVLIFFFKVRVKGKKVSSA